MKTIFLPIICLAILSFSEADTNKKLKRIPVSGSVTETRSYCGGARPNDEILTQLGTPRPVANKKIYIKAGEVNSPESKVLQVLTTDANGNFSTKLRPGKYLVVDSAKKDMSYFNFLAKNYKTPTSSYEAIDTLCLKEWHTKPALVFEVKETAISGLSVNFHLTCPEVLPCTRYKGPFRQ